MVSLFSRKGRNCTRHEGPRPEGLFRHLAWVCLLVVLVAAASCASTSDKPGVEQPLIDEGAAEATGGAETPPPGATAETRAARPDNPRVLFMIAEKSIGEKLYNFWWYGSAEYRAEVTESLAAETALKEAFIDRGFRVVDVSASTGRFEIRDRFHVADLTREETVSIGRDLDAEVVVYGRAAVEEGPGTPGSNVGVYLAEISAQAVRVDDGTVLGASTGHGAARHISGLTGSTLALRSAAADLSSRLISRITARLTEPGPMTVTVTLSKVAGSAEVARFKETLATRVRGVEAVYQRGLEAGVAVFEVRSTATAGEIADALAGLPGLKVTGTTPGTVDVGYGR